LQIDVLAKPAGTSCHNLTDKGCAIYENRPISPCKTFVCAWLYGLMDDDDRPDKSGAIVWQTNINNERTTIVSCPADREPSTKLLAFLKENIKTPIRLERIDKEPVKVEWG
jgi:hypothetical protein